MTLDLLKKLLESVPQKYERKYLVRAFEVITVNDEAEMEFNEKYRALRRTFQLLGPDEIKLETFEDYKWLSAIFTYYMKMVDDPACG